jgi:hypothetical protein
MYFHPYKILITQELLPTDYATRLQFARQMTTKLASKEIPREFQWPPCSPDLSVCDYFLWDYLKQRVYVNKPHTLDQLRTNIETEIANISPAILQKVFKNFEKRLENCIERNGHHLNNVYFKK